MISPQYFIQKFYHGCILFSIFFTKKAIHLPLIESLRLLAIFLLNLLEINILPYHTMGLKKYRKLRMPYPMKTLEKHTQEELDNVLQIMKSYGLKAKLNG